MSSNAVTYARIVHARGVAERSSRRAFFAVLGLVFAGSAVLTVRSCESMSATGGMAMPGGWTMSMAWMRIPGQRWAGAAASFLGMWMVMMVAMMLPSLAPVLWGYRQALGGLGAWRLNWLTALVGAGYFAVWGGLGFVVFEVGGVAVEAEMRAPLLSRAIPTASVVVVLLAAALQLSGWKAHHLACWRDISGWPAADPGAAWKRGLRLGFHCICGCAGWTAMLVVMGVMDLRVMAVVTAAITMERLVPAGERIRRTMGAVAIGVACCLWCG
ncbi:MAG TPA: DUF2182 domain-containing protein [Terriglobales bacterium]|nr:DUF2182 domain-containing protein [Terriglobales bacterium]